MPRDRADVATQKILDALDAATPPPPYKFCRVDSIVPGVSATLNYSGASLTIPKARMLCASFPVAGTTVLVGMNGLDRFILAVPLP